jgi:hypothetical protein
MHQHIYDVVTLFILLSTDRFEFLYLFFFSLLSKRHHYLLKTLAYFLTSAD